jgi:hypothetical protein
VFERGIMVAKKLTIIVVADADMIAAATEKSTGDGATREDEAGE